MKRLLIAGPGRSGTSVLVAIISKMGVSSSADDGRWFSDARAGFETEFDSETSPLIVKDPTLTWKLPTMLRSGEISADEIRIVLVPFRELDVAAASRWEVARGARSPTAAGALTGTLRPTKQAEQLARDLWRLLLILKEYDIAYRLVHYPRFMIDEMYFLEMTRSVFPDVIDTKASEAWRELRDHDLIRFEIARPAGLLADAQAVSWVLARWTRRKTRRFVRSGAARLWGASR